MGSQQPGADDQTSVERILGYVNLSSGAPDPQFLASLNRLFARFEGQSGAASAVCEYLAAELQGFAGSSAAFADVAQATRVLQTVQHDLLPAYLQFHADLLFHQKADHLFLPFFVGRACEAVLNQGPPWDETQRIVDGAIAQLNDFIGYRPVAALESRRHEPYAHEWVRPVPLYIQGAGVSVGRYAQVVQRALEILQATDSSILRMACFDPESLDELTFDPRAYDFDHPVNKRPNYHFGQWDPHQIDNQGRYRRFVVQQVTLDALMSRLVDVPDLPQEQLLFEAAAVLAGTLLMATGISGNGPTTYDSSVTLGTLLPVIANYRDVFYVQLIEQAEPLHRKRLLQEAQVKRQPFGGARQHLNAALARLRAAQMEHVELAKVFARMGHFDAATRQAGVVPVASSRMLCEIDCRLTAGLAAAESSELHEAARLGREVVDLLKRGIQCGAVIDPWNILGFDAHFSLFPALENSVHDHRADELVMLMERIFVYYSRVWSTAAAEDDQQVCEQVSTDFSLLSNWWRQFAAHEVSSVEADDPLEVLDAARHVAGALNLWHKGGAASGDIKFWAPHAHMFGSPKAFSLVIEALLERDDLVASMALLIQWLNQAETVPLQRGASSFHLQAQEWLLKLLKRTRQTDVPPSAVDEPRQLVCKFFDYLEANAEEYWTVPTFQLGGAVSRNGEPDMTQLDGEDDDQDGLYSAAYEDVVFRDSTDDGVEGELFDTGETTQDELSSESQRIADRLAFLSSLTRLWKLTAVSQGLCGQDEQAGATEGRDYVATIQHWIEQAAANRQGLLDLLDHVRAYRIPHTGVDHDSLMQYDRQRLIKETLLDRIVTTCVDVSVVGQVLVAALAARLPCDDAMVEQLAAPFGDDALPTIRVIAAVLGGDKEQVREQWPEMQHVLTGKTLLYVPLSKGGDPQENVGTRCRQCQLQDLLAWLPRRGLWVETCQLIEIARTMERANPVGPGAVTEFDELFKIGYKSLVDCLVTSAESWTDEEHPVESLDHALVNTLEELTELLLASWLTHSRTLRLSVLERISEEERWQRLVCFIERYGADVFTQQFFSLGNIRAILHQGVGNWLRRCEEQEDTELISKLVEEIDDKITRREAEEQLTLVLEAIVENYGEYRDYNSTTTQSDRGELLYTLLDFLRLRTEYDRICWHLKPVVLAHEILVRRKHDTAARLWRRALTDRIGKEATQYLRRLSALQKKYAIRMPTIADRLAERFVRPMAIDRIRALVQPAMEEATRPGPKPVFELLEHETDVLTRESTGVGFDIPAWLLALEDEVDRTRQPTHRHNLERQIVTAIDTVALSRAEVDQQLKDCAAL